MLNKGPHILPALRTLDDILRRMQSLRSKKRPLLRALKAWNGVGLVADAADALREPKPGKAARASRRTWRGGHARVTGASSAHHAVRRP